jgi:hypothetical protein
VKCLRSLVEEVQDKESEELFTIIRGGHVPHTDANSSWACQRERNREREIEREREGQERRLTDLRTCWRAVDEIGRGILTTPTEAEILFHLLASDP